MPFRAASACGRRRFPPGAAVFLAAALLGAGCLHEDDGAESVTVRETVTETAGETVPNEAPLLVSLYFLQEGKVWPEQRGIVSRPRNVTDTRSRPR